MPACLDLCGDGHGRPSPSGSRDDSEHAHTARKHVDREGPSDRVNGGFSRRVGRDLRIGERIVKRGDIDEHSMVGRQRCKATLASPHDVQHINCECGVPVVIAMFGERPANHSRTRAGDEYVDPSQAVYPAVHCHLRALASGQVCWYVRDGEARGSSP